MLNVGSYLPLYFLVIIGLPVAPSIAMSPSFSPLSPPTLQYIISRVYNCNLDTLTEGKGMDIGQEGGGGGGTLYTKINLKFVGIGRTNKEICFPLYFIVKINRKFPNKYFFWPTIKGFFVQCLFVRGARGE